MLAHAPHHTLLPHDIRASYPHQPTLLLLAEEGEDDLVLSDYTQVYGFDMLYFHAGEDTEDIHAYTEGIAGIINMHIAL